MYCDKITSGAEDRALCQALLDCMRSTHCWLEDPNRCYCGTAMDTACLIEPNGVCRDQVFAATKTTNATDAGIRFYDTTYPAGYATQVIGCDWGFCSLRSEPPRDICR
jgi:hypothetical protein